MPNPFFIMQNLVSLPANSKPKSTFAYPKSTLDLRLEKSIWGDNGLQKPLLPAGQPSFPPIMRRPSRHVGLIQTDTGRKMNLSFPRFSPFSFFIPGVSFPNVRNDFRPA
jgi:hypothetical protein